MQTHPEQLIRQATGTARRPLRIGRGEALAAAGGLALLIVMFLSWFEQRSTGGLSGRGTGAPAIQVDAWDALGALAVLLAIATAIPLGNALLRLVRAPTLPAVAVAGAGVLALLIVLVAAATTLGEHGPSDPDALLVFSMPEIGLFLGFAAAVLTAYGGVLTALEAHRRKAAP